jgi:DNA-binding MarR family transcriptional regulator
MKCNDISKKNFLPEDINVIEGSESNTKRLVSRQRILPYHSLLDRIQVRLDFLLNHLYLISRASFDQPHMSEFGVNMREGMALEMLYSSKNGLPQHVLGAFLNINPNVNVKLIDKLECRSLVERRTNPTNRKENLVSLTETGMAFVERMLRAVDAKNRDVLAGLPEGALLLLITKMEKDAALSAEQHN